MDHKSRDRWSLQWMIDRGVLHGTLVACVGWIFGMLILGGIFRGLLGMLPGYLIGVLIHRIVAGASARAAGAFYAPRGASTAYVPTYSQIDALVIRGDLAGAAAAFDEEIARSGGQVGVLVKAADFHLRDRRDAPRALALFLRARETGSGSDDTRRYIQQKLVDLYLGPLEAEGKAMAELRRLIERFPGTREAAAARESLAALKRERELRGPQGGG